MLLIVVEGLLIDQLLKEVHSNLLDNILLLCKQLDVTGKQKHTLTNFNSYMTEISTKLLFSPILLQLAGQDLA